MSDNLDIHVNKVEVIKLGSISKFEGASETATERLQRITLMPLVWFFITSNAVICIGVFTFAIIERRHPSFGDHIITSNVVIAVITGNTIQISAIIIAAYKQLFQKNPPKGGNKEKSRINRKKEKNTVSL